MGLFAYFPVDMVQAVKSLEVLDEMFLEVVELGLIFRVIEKSPNPVRFTFRLMFVRALSSLSLRVCTVAAKAVAVSGGGVTSR